MTAATHGWKCFKSDSKGRLLCRDHVFEVGGTYEVEGPVVLCNSGFHFHEHGGDLFNYYENKSETRVCEIIAHEVVTAGDKSTCRRIEIVRELRRAWNDEGSTGNGYQPQQDIKAQILSLAV